jgi:glycosyltransferase involved in cell wall biosynthesis
MATLSVVISAYNEEAHLQTCLSSVSWANEIIVVNNSSTDKTKEIAKQFTNKIFDKPNNLMLNINKNFGFSKATGDFILNLDGDEEITKELASEIKEILKSRKTYDGYWIPRKNIIFGKWIQHGLWWPDRQIRLFKKEHGIFPCVHIHEYIKIDGTIGECKEPYIHHNYDSIHQYLTKIDRASTSESLTLIENSYTVLWFDAIRFPLSDFIKIYFAQQGFKDGLHGLVLSLLQAFYSFCTFAKVWEHQKFDQKEIPLSLVGKELGLSKRQIHYWYISALIQTSQSFLKRFLLKIRRKLLV